MAVMELGMDYFESLVAEGKTVIDFYASWCGPCKMMNPILEELSSEVPDVKFFKIDVDRELELAMRFNVMSVPTLLVVEDGEIIDKTIGLISKKELLNIIY